MIVVAIIAILATIAVPSFMRARKRSQATVCLNELRVLNDAYANYLIENPSSTYAEAMLPGQSLVPYLKPGDLLDRVVGWGNANAVPAAVTASAAGSYYFLKPTQDLSALSAETYKISTYTLGLDILQQLQDVTKPEFWGSYVHPYDIDLVW